MADLLTVEFSSLPVGNVKDTTTVLGYDPTQNPPYFRPSLEQGAQFPPGTFGQVLFKTADGVAFSNLPSATPEFAGMVKMATAINASDTGVPIGIQVFQQLNTKITFPTGGSNGKVLQWGAGNSATWVTPAAGVSTGAANTWTARQTFASGAALTNAVGTSANTTPFLEGYGSAAAQPAKTVILRNTEQFLIGSADPTGEDGSYLKVIVGDETTSKIELRGSSGFLLKNWLTDRDPITLYGSAPIQYNPDLASKPFTAYEINALPSQMAIKAYVDSVALPPTPSAATSIAPAVLFYDGTKTGWAGYGSNSGQYIPGWFHVDDLATRGDVSVGGSLTVGNRADFNDGLFAARKITYTGGNFSYQTWSVFGTTEVPSKGAIIQYVESQPGGGLPPKPADLLSGVGVLTVDTAGGYSWKGYSSAGGVNFLPQIFAEGLASTKPVSYEASGLGSWSEFDSYDAPCKSAIEEYVYSMMPTQYPFPEIPRWAGDAYTSSALLVSDSNGNLSWRGQTEGSTPRGIEGRVTFDEVAAHGVKVDQISTYSYMYSEDVINKGTYDKNMATLAWYGGSGGLQQLNSNISSALASSQRYRVTLQCTGPNGSQSFSNIVNSYYLTGTVYKGSGSPIRTMLVGGWARTGSSSSATAFAHPCLAWGPGDLRVGWKEENSGSEVNELKDFCITWDITWSTGYSFFTGGDYSSWGVSITPLVASRP